MEGGVLMNRDRGRIKWTAMMLPEHLKMLRDWVEEDFYNEKPENDDWTLQELQQQLDIALQSRCEVRIKTWENGIFTAATGIVTKIDERLQLLYLEESLTTHKIPLRMVVEIEILSFE